MVTAIFSGTVQNTSAGPVVYELSVAVVNSNMPPVPPFKVPVNGGAAVAAGDSVAAGFTLTVPDVLRAPQPPNQGLRLRVNLDSLVPPKLLLSQRLSQTYVLPALGARHGVLRGGMRMAVSAG